MFIFVLLYLLFKYIEYPSQRNQLMWLFVRFWRFNCFTLLKNFSNSPIRNTSLQRLTIVCIFFFNRENRKLVKNRKQLIKKQWIKNAQQLHDIGNQWSSQLMRWELNWKKKKIWVFRCSEGCSITARVNRETDRDRYFARVDEKISPTLARWDRRVVHRRD